MAHTGLKNQLLLSWLSNNANFFTLRCHVPRRVQHLIFIFEYLRKMEAIFNHFKECQSGARIGYFSDKRGVKISWHCPYNNLSSPLPLLNSISNIPAVYLMSLTDWEKTVWPPYCSKASFYLLTVMNALVFMNLLVTRDFCPLFPASLEIFGGIFFHKWNPPSVRMNYHFLMWIGIKLHLWLFIFA